MREIGTDHTPYIQYITNTKKLTLQCDGITMLDECIFNYERLFRFINCDLCAFTSDLQYLYENSFEHFSDFEYCVSKIAEHLKEIFSISHIIFTRDFLQVDYIEYIRHKICDATTAESENIKKLFLHFMANLYKLRDNYKEPINDSSFGIFDDDFDKTFFEDIFETDILPYSQVQGPLKEFITSATPPCSLLLLQEKINLYLSWNITKNEHFRLNAQNHQTSMEYMQLIENAKNKPQSEQSLSERTAWKLYLSQQHFKEMYPDKSYEDLFLLNGDFRPGVSYPPYAFSYWKDIKIDFTYPSYSYKEIAYCFDHIEGILVLDMYYFIKSGHYVFQCPHCKKKCENTRLTYYCNDKCKNSHREAVKKNCQPWRKYEKIRKKLQKRFARNSYSPRDYNQYEYELSEIINLFFDFKIDSDTALNLLDEKSYEIDQIFKQMHDNKYIYTILK